MEDFEEISRDELVHRTRDAEEKMRQAALYGNELLHDLAVTREDRDKLIGQVSERDQMLHELRGQLDLKTGVQNSWLEDLELARNEVSKLKEENADLKEEIRRLESQVLSLKLESNVKTEKHQAEVFNLRTCHEQEVETLRSELTALLERSGSKDASGLNLSDSFSTAAIVSELAEVKKEKDEMTRHYNESLSREAELKKRLEQTKHEVEDARHDLSTQQSLLQCAQTQVETARNERAEIAAELEIMRAGNQGGGFRGNSLFSELEDRRVKAEKRLVTEQEKYKDLEQRYMAKIDELREFKDEFMARLSSAHRSGQSAEEIRLHELTTRILDLESQLASERSQKERKEKSKEADLRQQMELVSAFAPPAASAGGGSAADPATSHYQDLLRSKTCKVEELKSILQAKEKEVVHLRMKNREALDKTVSVERELKESSSTALRLKFTVEDMRQEIEYLRSKGNGTSKEDPPKQKDGRKSFKATQGRPSNSKENSSFSVLSTPSDKISPNNVTFNKSLFQSSHIYQASEDVSKTKDEKPSVVKGAPQKPKVPVLKTVNLDSPKSFETDKRAPNLPTYSADTENDDEKCRSM